MNILLLTYPKTFVEVCDLYRQKTNAIIHDSLFLKALQLKGYCIAFEKNSPIVHVRINANGNERNLKFVCLDAEKILSGNDIAKYKTTAASIKKFYGEIEK